VHLYIYRRYTYLGGGGVKIVYRDIRIIALHSFVRNIFDSNLNKISIINNKVFVSIK